MSHMSSGFYRDRLGFDPNKESSAPASATASSAMSASSMTRRTVTSTSYSSSSLNRQEASRNVQSSSSSAAGHYAVSSHVSNGNLVVDNGGGVIQTQSGNHYEENLGKFKGRAQSFFICITIYYIIIDIFT